MRAGAVRDAAHTTPHPIPPLSGWGASSFGTDAGLRNAILRCVIRDGPGDSARHGAELPQGGAVGPLRGPSTANAPPGVEGGCRVGCSSSGFQGPPGAVAARCPNLAGPLIFRLLRRTITAGWVARRIRLDRCTVGPPMAETLLITLSGEIDLAQVEVLRDAHAAFQRSAASTAVVDLSDVDVLRQRGLRAACPTPPRDSATRRHADCGQSQPNGGADHRDLRSP